MTDANVQTASGREPAAELSKTEFIHLYAYRYGYEDGEVYRDACYAQGHPDATAEESLTYLKERTFRGSGMVLVGEPETIFARKGQDRYELMEEFNSSRHRTPWAGEKFWQEGAATWPRHLPWHSERHPGLLSYYQTEAKRAQDVRTPIKPGRYLKKFFGDVLTEEEIQELAIAWHTWSTPPELHITADADEIEEVYTSGPSSCMSHGADDYASYCHPVRVYAGPDLALAYIKDGDGRPAARALVWPEKMVHGRVYGDYHRLKTALASAGFTGGDFDGARIRRLWDDDHHCLVLPYVDGRAGYATDDGEFVRLGIRGDISVQDPDYVNGLQEGGNVSRYSCDACDDRIDEDDAYNNDHGTYCHSCYAERFFTCDATGDHDIPQDQAHEGPGGEQYCPEADTFYCDATELWYPMSRVAWMRGRTYEPIEMANGETWEMGYFERNGATCQHSAENYPIGELVTASNGEFVHPDELEEYEVEIEAGNVKVVGRDEHPDQLELPVTVAPVAPEVPMALLHDWQGEDGRFTAPEVEVFDLTYYGSYRAVRVNAPNCEGHRCDGRRLNPDGWYIEPHRLTPLNKAAADLLGRDWGTDRGILADALSEACLAA